MKKRKCPFCKKEQKSGSSHIYRCSKELNKEKSKKEIKKEYIEFNFPEISKKSTLKLEYQKKLKSLPDLKKEYGIDSKSIVFLLDYYQIKKRSISESAKKISHKKYTETCKKKYGVDNVSKLKSIKEKKAQTFIKNYGVDNIRKCKNFKSWLKNYMLETYGVGSLPNKNGNANSWGWKNLSLEEKQKRLKKMHSNYESIIEKKVQKLLTELNIPYTTQFFISNRSFDIKINNSNKIIEINGDYWHANPEIYNENDTFSKNQTQMTAKDIWKSDSDKKKLANSKGYEVLYIWEKDINNKNSDEIKIAILDFLSE
jgi:G:T-mismatch repair DNA endonuclease (very short patch repair protein)